MRRLALLAVGGALALAGPALAHRGHASLSVVEIDGATGAVTVTHRMAAHDVEPALISIAPDAQPSLDDAEALKTLEAYVGREFRLWDDQGRQAPLTHVSTELTGDRVTLTYSARLPAPAKAVRVDSNLFEETHMDQENQVNVRRAKVTKTALFRIGSEPETVAFD